MLIFNRRTILAAVLAISAGVVPAAAQDKVGVITDAGFLGRHGQGKMRDIKPLVAPRSIAVIGASTNPNKSGGILFSNLANGGFSGKLYPINPNASEIMGLKAYAAIGDLPEKVDLVYIVLPSQHMTSK